MGFIVKHYEADEDTPETIHISMDHSEARKISKLQARIAELDRQLGSMAATSDGFQLDLVHAKSRITELEAELDEARRERNIYAEDAGSLNHALEQLKAERDAERHNCDKWRTRYDELNNTAKPLLEANALLAEVEWCMEDISCQKYCPICGVLSFMGHASDCRLAAHLEPKGVGK